jgi:diguanylate cyclase (GGDEF)-like protein
MLKLIFVFGIVSHPVFYLVLTYGCHFRESPVFRIIASIIYVSILLIVKNNLNTVEKKFAFELSLFITLPVFFSYLCALNELNKYWFSSMIFCSIAYGMLSKIYISILAFPLGIFSGITMLCYIHKECSLNHTSVFQMIIVSEFTLIILSFIRSYMEAGYVLLQDLYKELGEKNLQLKELSYTDQMTDLRNRRFVQDVIKTKAAGFIYSKINMEIKKRNLDLENKIIGVCLIDVDNFKQVNDIYGHDAGDKMLISVADTIKNIIRHDDVVVRWGGEEFLILLWPTELEFLDIFAGKLLQSIRQNQVSIDGINNLSVTISGGIVPFPFYRENVEKISFEEVVAIADHGLYLAKNQQKNRMVKILPGEKEYSFKEIYYTSNTPSPENPDIKFVSSMEIC